jgi:solute carrier family 41
VFVEVNEIIVLVPALLGLKGNLDMSLASRLSTQVINKLN